MRHTDQPRARAGRRGHRGRPASSLSSSPRAGPPPRAGTRRWRRRACPGGPASPLSSACLRDRWAPGLLHEPGSAGGRFWPLRALRLHPIKQSRRSKRTPVHIRIPESRDRVEVVTGRVALVLVEAVARIPRVQSCIIRSRVTFAMIDAAAIAVQRESPWITARCAISRSGIRKASTSTQSGEGASTSTARCIARSDAWWMLMESISSGWAAATPRPPRRG